MPFFEFEATLARDGGARRRRRLFLAGGNLHWRQETAEYVGDDGQIHLDPVLDKELRSILHAEIEPGQVRKCKVRVTY